MLRQLFVRHHARYERSPYAEDLTAFACWLDQAGYKARYIQRLLFRVKQSLEKSFAPLGAAFTQSDLDRTFRHPRQQVLYNHARSAFKNFLTSAGRFITDTPTDPHAILRKAYQHYLSVRKGLAPNTVKHRDWAVGNFLNRALPEGQPLSDLTASVVEHHIEKRSRELSRRALLSTVEFLKAFLRYCFEQDLIPTRLDTIDRPVRYRDPLPPKALDWQTVQTFLHSIDRRSRTG